jgi:hypothetical protein
MALLHASSGHNLIYRRTAGDCLVGDSASRRGRRLFNIGSNAAASDVYYPAGAAGYHGPVTRSCERCCRFRGLLLFSLPNGRTNSNPRQYRLNHPRNVSTKRYAPMLRGREPQLSANCSSLDSWNFFTLILK